MKNGKRGKKVHWSAEGLDSSPCGLSTTYYHGVSVDEFGNLEKKQRCLRCNNAYREHKRSFLHVNKIYEHKMWLGHKHTSQGLKRGYMTLHRLVLSCQYAINSGEPYQKIKVEYVDFNHDFSYLKRSNSFTDSIWLSGGNHYRNNEIPKTPEQIKNIKRLIKLL